VHTLNTQHKKPQLFTTQAAVSIQWGIIVVP